MHSSVFSLPVLALIGHWEILVVAGFVIVIFFGKRIPEVMRSLGRGITQFKKGLHEPEDEKPALPAPGEAEKGDQKDGEEARAAGTGEQVEKPEDKPRDPPT